MSKDPAQVLRASAVIAVVGASRHLYKSAHTVPLSLQSHGFRIVPVNPEVSEIFGEKAYATLADIPFPVDAVEVFRPAADAPAIAAQAVAIGARALWLQSGIVSPEAREIAEAAGLDYIEDRCMAVDRALNQIQMR